MMNKRIKIVLLSVFALSLAMSGCYYDNEEDLYLGISSCDTTNVTYSGAVAPVFAGYCNSCHSESNKQKEIRTDTYELVVKDIDRISGAINHKNGYTPMPYPNGSLSACELTKFNIWVREGMPE